MQVLAQQMAEHFVSRVYEHVTKTHAGLVQSTPEDAVRQSIRAGIRRAGTYGIRAEYDVVRFIDLMYLLSPDFDSDPTTLWVHRLLDDPDLRAADKLNVIYRRLEDKTNRWRATGGATVGGAR
jgi:hypothetical protein